MLTGRSLMGTERTKTSLFCETSFSWETMLSFLYLFLSMLFRLFLQDCFPPRKLRFHDIQSSWQSIFFSGGFEAEIVRPLYSYIDPSTCERTEFRFSTDCVVRLRIMATTDICDFCGSLIILSDFMKIRWCRCRLIIWFICYNSFQDG